MTNINNAAIYSNPSPDNPCYIYVTLFSVELESVAGCDRPKLHARFLVAPMHGDSPTGDKHFSSIIHTTEKATPIWKAFCDTFRIVDGDYKAAVGRFGSVRLTAANFNGKEYGCIGYVNQPEHVRHVCAKMEEQEKQGTLMW